jgi:hypothetical protein
MTALACVPVCYTFAAILLVGLIVVGFGLVKLPKGSAEADANANSTDHISGPLGPPPLWVPLAFFVFLCALMAVLAWYWPE